MCARVTISGSIGGITIPSVEVDVDACMPEDCREEVTFFNGFNHPFNWVT
jgi:hypothetical protein